jgi:hypothetical protein
MELFVSVNLLHPIGPRQNDIKKEILKFKSIATNLPVPIAAETE